MPPRFPRASDFDGGFTFCRLMYRQVRQSSSADLAGAPIIPHAEMNFSIRLCELTKTRVSQTGAEPNHFVVRPTDEWLDLCPDRDHVRPGQRRFQRGRRGRAARLSA